MKPATRSISTPLTPFAMLVDRPSHVTQLPSVSDVLLMAYPAKIRNVVILRIGIEMIHLWKGFGIWDKGSGDKPMNRNCLDFIILAQGNKEVRREAGR